MQAAQRKKWTEHVWCAEKRIYSVLDSVIFSKVREHGWTIQNCTDDVRVNQRKKMRTTRNLFSIGKITPVFWTQTPCLAIHLWHCLNSSKKKKTVCPDFSPIRALRPLCVACPGWSASCCACLEPRNPDSHVHSWPCTTEISVYVRENQIQNASFLWSISAT